MTRKQANHKRRIGWIAKIKLSKAPAIDNIISETFKYMGIIEKEAFRDLLNEITKTRKI